MRNFTAGIEDTGAIAGIYKLSVRSEKMKRSDVGKIEPTGEEWNAKPDGRRSEGFIAY